MSRPVRATQLHDTASRSQMHGTSQGTVAHGQTAFALLRQAGVSAPEVLRLQRAIRSLYDIHHLRVGQPYWVDVTADGLLQHFAYEIDTQHRLEVERHGQTFRGRLIPMGYKHQERIVHGVIHGSLYETLASQGEPAKMAADLVDIFAWEVDFPKEVQEGATFRLLIQEFSRNGTVVEYHRILAAALMNQDRLMQAVYYAPDGNEGAYYHPDGRSLRRMFLRSPLRYTRISSPFSRRRLHPILGQYRPHFGIDYAAPSGTPVHSVADGVVIQAGRNGANGNMIKIRHNRVYSTYYLHLSRFARGVRTGRRVTQGQVIGYVGSTGLATGPHLCFRLTKNGTYLNPLRHPSLETPPLSRQELPAFQTYADRVLARLAPSEGAPQQVVAHIPALGDQNLEANGK
jgi:murein DD-endopeptidase MepM/ murein hydrolase activator NlpD